MRFLFLHIHEENNKCYITGCFERCKQGTEERETLDLIATCIDEVNAKSFKSSKIVLKDKTIFFRAIDADWLVSALKYWDNSLGLLLTYKLGRNTTFTGSKSREIFEKVIQRHKITVDSP